MSSRNLPIGVFDSGVGGLTVVNNILRVMPGESIVYFADSKYFPYGTRTEEEIKSFSERITRFLVNKGVKAIVVACNTASSTAIKEIKNVAQDTPVFGMIQYGAKYATKTTRNNKVCIISTPLTAKKHAYRNEIKRMNPAIEVFEVGSQDLVNLVEDGILHNQYAQSLTQERLREPLSKGVDTLVLGCTHFPFLERVVRSVVGENVSVLDPSHYLVTQLKEFLEKRGLLSDKLISKIELYTSGKLGDFLEKVSLFLGNVKFDAFAVDI